MRTSDETNSLLVSPIYIGQSQKGGEKKYKKKEPMLSKSLQAINAGEDVEKREPSYTVGGNAN